jgi:aldose 1-epimerase
MSASEIVSLEWEKLPALELRAGENRALVLPGIGGNVLSLEDARGPYLRTPGSIGEYLALPEAFGLPVLFPPNRIMGASFSARGVEYRFPVNRPNNVHIHGFLSARPWQVERLSAGDDAAELELSFSSTAEGEIYRWFPHPFRARLVYRLESRGLFQRISFENRGGTPMPFMLGFHSAFALPGRDRDPESYRVRIALGDRLDGDQLTALQKPEEAFRSGWIIPGGQDISGQYVADPFPDEAGQPFHGAVFENLRTGTRLRYITDEQYRYWVIWNYNGNDSFLCVEPQTCAINAANMHREKDLFGFRMLGPAETFTARSALLLDSVRP